MQETGASIFDGDDEVDNVENTGLNFSRLDVHELSLAILELDTGEEVTAEIPVSAPTSASTTIEVTTQANDPVVNVVDLASGESRDDVNFGVRLSNVAPVVDAGLDQSVDQGQLFSRTGTVTDLNVGDTLTATVDYGEGLGAEALDLVDGTFELSNTYTSIGDFDVVVTVTDAAGAVGSTQFVVTVENVAPVVALDEPSATIDEGSTATLTGTFNDAGGLSLIHI